MELKIQCPQERAGSTPAAGIVIKTRFSDLVFFLPIFIFWVIYNFLCSARSSDFLFFSLFCAKLNIVKQVTEDFLKGETYGNDRSGTSSEKFCEDS